MEVAERTPGSTVLDWTRRLTGGGGQGQQSQQGPTNVGESERAVSVASGAVLALAGLGRGGMPGLLMVGVGGALLHRGVTGHCHAYQALGYDTANVEVDPAEIERRGIHVEQSYTIDKSPQDLYVYWRNFENLPRIMTHLESVRVIDDRRSHWVAKAPAIVGGRVEWDAEITEQQPGAVIAWRSLPGADIDNSGSVRFEGNPRGTIVRVKLSYIAPAGRFGKWVAKLFGEEPEQQIHEDLRNFKRVMETGEVATTAGQPRGTCTGHGKREGARFSGS